MLKRNLLSVVVLLLVLMIPVLGFAHSGGTDGKGGHRDRSTGEYHYHHGYSEHYHYDIDGDDRDDCPIDFDYTSLVGYGMGYESGYEDGYDDGYNVGNDKGYRAGRTDGYDNGYEDGYDDGKPLVPKWCFFVFAAAALTIFILSLVCRSYRKKANEDN